MGQQESSIISLAQEAVSDGLVQQEVLDHLTSLHPQVPDAMKQRYLLACFRTELQRLGVNDQPVLVDKFSKYIAGKAPSDDLLLGPEHIPDLTELLVRYACEWRSIGTALRFQPQDLKNIQTDPLLMHDAPNSYLIRLIEDWVQKKLEHTLPPTRNNLKKALRSQTVRLGTLANELQDFNLICKKPNDHFSYSSIVVSLVPSDKESRALQESSIQLEEGASTLLEIQTTSGKDGVAYQWFQDGERIQNRRAPKSFHYLPKVDIDRDGCKFSCKVSYGHNSVQTAPVKLNVSCSLDKFRMNLASMYLAQPEIPENAWPPIGTKEYINLALIKQQQVINYGSEYARVTIRGDMDDILKHKDKIEYSEVYKSLKSGQLILVEGRPGSGKTTFVHKIARDWANKSGGAIRLLLLVSLRLLNTLPNLDLSDILMLFFKDAKVNQELVKERAGKGVCFIFDGLDEFLPPDGNKSIVHQIINKAYLNQSTVIVASRPAAIAKLRNRANKVIEVLGFLNEQIHEYFDHYPFSDSLKPAELRSYLSAHPNILRMCYLPIHTNMVAFLFMVTGTVPETETEIYTHFTHFTLKRSLAKSDEIEPINVDIHSLNGEQQMYFKQICQLALKKTLSQKQVLDQDEVSSYFQVKTDKKDRSLGLITIDRTAGLYDFKDIYTFLHLTFQEYLAAFHISTLSDGEQNKLFQEHGHEDHMLVVWKFCCGLKVFVGKFNFFLKETKGNREGNTLFQIQCAYESQQQIACEQLLEARNHSIRLEEKSLSITDFTAIGYIANVSVLPFNLSLIECNFDSTSIVALLSKMDDRAKHLLQRLLIEAETIDNEQMLCIEQLLTHLGSLKFLVIEARNEHIQHHYDVKFHIKITNLMELSMIHVDTVPLMLLNALPYSRLTKINLRGSVRKLKELSVLADGLQYCINLKVLILSDNKVEGIGAKLLADNLIKCKKLERFDISNNITIPNSGMIAILDNIKSHSLKLRLEDISPNGLKDEELIDHLKEFASLESLDISLNYAASTTFFVNSKGWRKLQELHVCSEPNYLMNTTLFICDSLQHFHELIVLTLNKSIKDVEGAMALRDGLRQCPKLQVLDLSGNIIECAEIKIISVSLANLTSLEELYLKNNHIADEGAESLCSCVQHLHNLQVLDLQNNRISRSGWMFLAANFTSLNQ